MEMKPAKEFTITNLFQSAYFLILISWGSFFLYLWPQMLRRTTEGLAAGTPIVWADWALHFCISSVFAFRPLTQWFRFHPIYVGRKLDYPFVVDAISGLLIRCGVSYRLAFVVPSVFLTGLFLYALARLFRKERLNAWESVAAISILFLNGGMGFVGFLAKVNQPSSGLYSLWHEAGVQFGNTLLTEFLPQRAFLLGLPVTIFLILEITKRWENDFRIGSQRSFFLLGMAAGSLILVHAHSLIALAIYSSLLLAMKPRLFLCWVPYEAGAVLVCLTWFVLFRRGVSGGGFFEWVPGWMSGRESNNLNWVAFWFLNWGIFLPLSILATIRMGMGKRPLVLFGFVLFILCNLIKFQPWIWDNTKLFTYAYVCLSIPIVAYLGHIFRKGGWMGKAGAGMCFTLLIATGVLDVGRAVGQLDQPIVLWSESELRLAEAFRGISSAQDLTLASTNHHHWIASVSGRQIVLGYPGWLASYGIAYSKSLRDVGTIYAGGEAALALLKEYGIRFVVIGPFEREEFHLDQRFFDRFPVVLSDRENKIYRID
jgi:hypothetical protein